LIFRITAPVGAGDTVELKRVRQNIFFGIFRVSALAKIDKIAERVKSQCLSALGEFFDQLRLVNVPRKFFFCFVDIDFALLR
jgi:hypothetical protein